jgi:hypothetical protein
MRGRVVTRDESRTIANAVARKRAMDRVSMQSRARCQTAACPVSGRNVQSTHLPSTVTTATTANASSVACR